MNFSSKQKAWFIVFATIISYIFVAFFLERTSFNILLICWIFLFGCFYYTLKNTDFSFKELIVISFVCRGIFLFATPNLSQDFYRFIWDGRMLFAGFNPYETTPESFINNAIFPINEAKLLYNGMGILNGSHFTNYPPIHQIGFLIAALFANKSIFGSIIVLRILNILADVGILWIGKKLLDRLQLPIQRIFWYLLNPFIIIETTGNLHFEPIMVFFLLMSLYKLHQQKWFLGALFMGCAISVKLIPILFLPLFFQWFSSKKINHQSSFKERFFRMFSKQNILQLTLFYMSILGVVLLLFTPFISQNLISNFTKSVGLWFSTFEFNASIYYVLREIGYYFYGYNQIANIGKITAVTTILYVLFLAIYKENNTLKKTINSMLLAVTYYYFLSSTVHPWYIATPLILCIFTNYRYPIIWTFVIVLSYEAYANLPWKENLWVVFFQYFLLFSYIIYEIKKHIVKKTIL